MEHGTDWPARAGSERADQIALRRWLGNIARIVGLGAAFWSVFANARLTTAQTAVLAAVTTVGALAFVGFLRFAEARRLTLSLACLGIVAVQACFSALDGGGLIGILFMCGIALGALQRLPLGAAVPALVLSLSAFVAVAPHGVRHWSNVATVLGLGVLGYVLRLDAAARANTRALLEQERAAHAARAETAALAERARIAREIHDVLAHSLSAQLVHLEAARLLLDRGAPREQLRERIVAARKMAQDGLTETRQALSALRGEFTPVGEFLQELAKDHDAGLEVEGVPRPLPAEAGMAVRRTAQEALTNVRKHAPGAETRIRLVYGPDGDVELEVLSGAGRRPAELTGSGSGYGLLGMRERAELLGGELETGPHGDGFRVLLRLPGEEQPPSGAG